jgi:hypothetical protein
MSGTYAQRKDPHPFHLGHYQHVMRRSPRHICVTAGLILFAMCSPCCAQAAAGIEDI